MSGRGSSARSRRAARGSGTENVAPALVALDDDAPRGRVTQAAPVVAPPRLASSTARACLDCGIDERRGPDGQRRENRHHEKSLHGVPPVLWLATWIRLNRSFRKRERAAVPCCEAGRLPLSRNSPTVSPALLTIRSSTPVTGWSEQSRLDRLGKERASITGKTGIGLHSR